MPWIRKENSAGLIAFQSRNCAPDLKMKSRKKNVIILNIMMMKEHNIMESYDLEAIAILTHRHRKPVSGV